MDSHTENKLPVLLDTAVESGHHTVYAVLERKSEVAASKAGKDYTE
jgi:hypothetical protein